MIRRLVPMLCALIPPAACSDLNEVGRAPEFTRIEDSNQYSALYSTPFPDMAEETGAGSDASLWTASRASLFGDRRAMQRGDILTVVIEIDEGAQISNSTGRSRSGSEAMGIPSLFGLPQNVADDLPEGASLDEAVDASSSSSFSGEGSVARNEQLTLRVAATVVERLANGVLRIQGQQEVRVNHELRELLVEGYVRPVDITRQNEITYDKIAGARISYGGRGRLTEVQQPRYGQQILDILLPF